jgi:hypothetical protein
VAGIDDVLERLLTDAGFAQRLAQDPVGALAGYELSVDDLALLATQVSFDRGALSQVEERISKAGMFGLLGSFAAGLGQGAFVPAVRAGPGVIGPSDIQGVIGPSDIQGGMTPPDGTHGIIVNDLGNPEASHGFNPQPDRPPGPTRTPSSDRSTRTVSSHRSTRTASSHRWTRTLMPRAS